MGLGPTAFPSQPNHAPACPLPHPAHSAYPPPTARGRPPGASRTGGIMHLFSLNVEDFCVFGVNRRLGSFNSASGVRLQTAVQYSTNAIQNQAQPTGSNTWNGCDRRGWSGRGACAWFTPQTPVKLGDRTTHPTTYPLQQADPIHALWK
jgi:hypothetical protein